MTKQTTSCFDLLNLQEGMNDLEFVVAKFHNKFLLTQQSLKSFNLLRESGDTVVTCPVAGSGETVN